MIRTFPLTSWKIFHRNVKYHFYVSSSASADNILIKKVISHAHVLNVEEIFHFCQHLFQTVQLSPECTICLPHLHRTSKGASRFALLTTTWQPIVICGLLCASKVNMDKHAWDHFWGSLYLWIGLSRLEFVECQVYLHLSIASSSMHQSIGEVVLDHI